MLGLRTQKLELDGVGTVTVRELMFEEEKLMRSGDMIAIVEKCCTDEKGEPFFNAERPVTKLPFRLAGEITTQIAILSDLNPDDIESGAEDEGKG